MIRTTLFDIEAGPLPEAEIAHLMPEFAAPGNYKDAEKIRAHIAQQRLDWLTQAALSPITGEVLCIGVSIAGANSPRIIAASERDTLVQFWDYAQTELFAGHLLAGWCIHHFDLPFLIKRSLKYGLDVPKLRIGTASQYWHENIVDLQVRWRLGDSQAPSSLDTVAKFLGLGAKNGDGADFGRLWREDRPKAEAYLLNDLQLTEAIYNRMKGLL